MQVDEPLIGQPMKASQLFKIRTELAAVAHRQIHFTAASVGRVRSEVEALAHLNLKRF
jgi:hypothetical protein